MTYQEALNYIYHIEWRGSRLGLSRIRSFLTLLGDPQKNLRFVHVAGTNGKGSVAKMLSEVFAASGYRTGLFVSPFVTKFNERIQYNNVGISEPEITELVEQMQPIAESMDDPPTQFEFLTAMGFLYFRKKNCQIVVLEVGLGGEFDATNVIDSSELSVITAIDYDHTHILGETMQEIARAKAGIIKQNGDVLFYGEHKEARAVISDRCLALHAVQHPFDLSEVEPLTLSAAGQTFRFRSDKPYCLSLLGEYQPCNAALVLAAVEILNRKGYRLSEDRVRDALAHTKWQARFELMETDPPFIVDGGHNPHAIRATVRTFQRLFPEQKATVILGMMEDKDVANSITALLPIAKTFYTVAVDMNRAMRADKLKEQIVGLGGTASDCATIREAVALAKNSETIVLAVGSLYVAGEVRKALGRTE